MTLEEAVCEVEKTDAHYIKVKGDFDAKDINSQLNDRNYHSIIIDLAPVNSRETLMHALYQHLRFPGYFGFNWDSLKDIFAVIDGVRQNGFVFVFSDLSQISDSDRESLIDVVEAANEVREEHDELARLRVLALNW